MDQRNAEDTSAAELMETVIGFGSKNEYSDVRR